MQVCMLIYNYWPQRVGGAEVQCRRLAKELTKRGMRVSVVTARLSFADAKKEVDEGVEIHRVGTLQLFVEWFLALKDSYRSPDIASGLLSQKNSRSVRSSRAVLSPIVAQMLQWSNSFVFMLCVAYTFFRLRTRIDLIHVHTTEWLAGFAVLLGRLIHAPVLCKEASTPAFLETHYPVPFLPVLNKLRFEASFIAMTEYVKVQMKEKGLQEDRIFLIPNGIRLPDTVASLQGRNIAIWVGNISQGIDTKGLDILLSAWTLVIQSIPSARLLLVGGGDPRLLNELILTNELGDHVRLEGFQAVVDDYYLSADLVAIPSRREGMSNVLLEALSFGVPVVASMIPANTSVVQDYDCGFIVPVGDAKMFAERIIEIFTDNLLRIQMGKKARALAANTFSFEVITDSVTDCYRQISASYKR